MKLQLSAVICLILATGGTLFSQPTKQPSPVVQGNSAFACELYQKLAVAEGNLFFSPYSISNALAMTYGGARGNTAKEMADTLHFDGDPGQFHASFGALVRQLNQADAKRKYRLTVANRLWGQKDFGFLPEFISASAQNYGAGLKEVDFAADVESARQEINAWVEKQTQNKIQELLKPGVIDRTTRMVLTNAIYFKAAWSTPFLEELTKPGDFFTSAAKKAKAPMMHQDLRTRYLDGGAFTALEMPYQQNELAMILLLPKERDGLAEFEKSITADNLAKWLGKMGSAKVDVTLPKFKTTAEFSLKKVLTDMGMRAAFDPGQADFTGLSSMKGLFISAVVHKAFIDVNEAGTEAAAATAVAIATSSLPQRVTFTADHPFVYLIRDNKTGSVLFMGRVVNP